MVDPSIVSALNISASDLKQTSLSTTTIQGTSNPEPCQLIAGLTISSIDGSHPIPLPSAYIYKSLPDAINEVPSKETIASIPGLQHLADQFTPKENWQTIVLIGRDCTRAQIQKNMTFSNDKRQIASQTPFGWVLIGESTVPTSSRVNWTASVHAISTSTYLPPDLTDNEAIKYLGEFITESNQEATDLQGHKNDELKGYAQDEITFLRKVALHAHQRNDGMIELPLPFTKTNPTFTFNRTVAKQRTKSELQKLKKRPEEFQSALNKFSKNTDMSVPRFIPVPHHQQFNTKGQAYWIPLFSVWQKGKSRIVFDSAAKTSNVCINDILMKGPDRNNSLRGVIHRFRRHPYAVTADVENMFHQFAIPKEQQTYLRFFWYRNNDPTQEIIEWYSRVHLQGLRSSPAIANTGIRFAARKNPPTNGSSWIEEDDLLDPYQTNRTWKPR